MSKFRSVEEGVLKWEMAGTVSEESGVGRSTEGFSSGQRCQSGEALAEWRSSEQVENGTPSTSPPDWETDDDNDGGMFCPVTPFSPQLYLHIQTTRNGRAFCLPLLGSVCLSL